MNAAQTDSRLHALDGLRGLLALMVVISHVAALAWAGIGNAPDPLTRVGFLLGPSAVDAFFVLSGIVVSRSLEARPRPYLTYLSGRMRRLLPLGFVGLTLSPIIRTLAPSIDGGLVSQLLSQPLDDDWPGILTLGLIPYEANHLNPPLWSLIVEQHIALLMPLLLLVAQRGVMPSLFVGVLALLCGFQVHSLWFVPAFLTGVLFRNVTSPARFAPLLTICGLLLWQHRLITGDDPLYRQSAMLGAAMLITGIRGWPDLSQWLSHPACQWLGKVSFSLYVTHFAVLMLGASLTNDPRTGAALFIPLTLPVAWACWKYVESKIS